MFIYIFLFIQIIYIFLYYIFRKSNFIKNLIYFILSLNILIIFLYKNIDFSFYLKNTYFSINISVIFYIFSNFISQNKKEKLIKESFFYIENYLIYILLIWFFIFINSITFLRHINFSTNAFDLWIFSQVIRKLSSFEFPSSSVRLIGNIFWDHFQPTLFIYAIFYKIFQSPLILIFLQNLAFVFWALWIYKISNLKLKNPIIGFIFTLMYLFFIGNTNVLLYDFHPDVIAFSLFPWLFYLSFIKKWFYFYLLVFFMLFSKENLSIYILFFWIYQIIFTKNRLIWISLFLIWSVYFYLVMNYFIPYMWWSNSSYWSYDLIWKTPKELIINSIENPLKVINVLFINDQKINIYMQYLSSWLLFALSPISILLIPSFAQKFLSTREEFWWFNFHYSIDIYWTLIISIILFLFYLKNKYKNKYGDLFAIIIVFIFINFIFVNFDPKINKLWDKIYLENKNNVLDAIKMIWKNDSVSAQNTIVPHLSNRVSIYIYPIINDSKYIILNEKAFDNQFWPFDNKIIYYDFLKKIYMWEKWNLFIDKPFFRNKVTLKSKYDLIYDKNWVLLFKKNNNAVN